MPNLIYFVIFTNTWFCVYDKTMLNQRDLNEIQHLTREEIKKETKFLPSKDDFYTMMDKIMFEIKAIHEEIELVIGRNRDTNDTLENHEVRIKKLEQTSNLA